ncbi:MAG: hypothetical protein M1822_006985 [Bathelium mastoideum]|nr:MAG: hypothetical protein M1822_006985 [Bathelium mastoideum]
MDLTFGVEFRVPDDAQIIVDVANPSQSTQHGFTYDTGLSIKPIPIQANFSAPKATISIKLTPKLTFGLVLGSGPVSADAQAGAFFDLPKLSLAIDPVSNVDAKCNSLSSLNSTIPHGAPLSPALGQAINVVPSAEFDFGLLEEAGLNLPDFKTDFAGSSATLASAIATLSTACLLWDQQNSRLADATSVVAASSSASVASASSASASSASAKATASAKGQGSRLGCAEERFIGVVLGFILSCGFGVIFF